MEMCSSYKSRKYMVRGVLDDKYGVFYEIVSHGLVVQTFLVYGCAILYADALNSL